MPPEQKKQAVNWTDGMKLNKDHFIEHENWVLDGIRNTASLRLTEFNYGLLYHNDISSLEVLLNVDQNNQLNIKVTDCLAITKGGRYIEIDIHNVQSLHYPLEKLSADFDIS